MYSTDTGVLDTGYVAPDGETPQTAGSVSAWFGVDAGQTLALTLAGTFAEASATLVQLRSTQNPVTPTVKLVATLEAAATTKYKVDYATWFQVYFLLQDGSEEITYTMTIDTPTFDTVVVNDTVDGKAYQLTTESGTITPVEV